MKLYADLHSHSKTSDGQYSPAQVVALAKEAGVELLALTDHDTVGGTEQAICAAQELGGIQVLRGVEMSAAGYRNFHIVGLNLQPGPNLLEEICQKQRENREERKYKIIEMLAGMGVEVTPEEVDKQAAGAAISRPHFARVMIDKGYVKTSQEAFARYLDGPEYHKLKYVRVTSADCIKGIHDAGGKAVLAHPYQLGFTHEKMDELLARLKEEGLDGIECHYPKHTPEQVEEYLAFAQKYDLHVSAGGDFHGPLVHPGDAFHPKEIDVDWIFEK